MWRPNCDNTIKDWFDKYVVSIQFHLFMAGFQISTNKGEVCLLTSGINVVFIKSLSLELSTTPKCLVSVTAESLCPYKSTQISMGVVLESNG